jgi:ubiquinone/menaquinone biosynthesis C-methylase UbiE
MRYDVTEEIPHKEFSKEFYEEIDKRFFGSVNQFMPWTEAPCDALIDYESLSEKDVLEVGVGNGSNAQLLAQSARSFTGIDITNYAVKSTKQRFRLAGLDGNVMQMDAENMSFEGNEFDFIWSWGVIHHSSNTRKVLEEIHRVLRPGGEAVIMVYHRSMWNTYIRGGLFYGILKGGFLKGKSPERVIQESTDGALARYYTVGEWKELVSDLFIVKKWEVFGSKSQIIPLPYGRVKESIMALIPNRVGRFITNRPFFGFLLVSTLQKRTL